METQSDSNLTDSNLSKIASGETWNYEATVAKVETIIRKIETGELELAEVFDQFSAAVEYLHQCEYFLDQRQQQMDLLIETLNNDSDF
ncbi:MAG: exodeoxyribonuclease VII small subunit [Moorea sp. SIO3I7]|uniref:exodeoxyribonuclease VII small subunit n=1 Tax=Moorena sp. SIO3I8 TaxID=2607833 RepID=UPI0013C20A6A|nr:exodeoxyribonuclease VII small subunit [Moorena sp. SIO3I8]NEN97134.1 exodeoxyribonuclease VII small subunit [Moorena sp. SIO3I7]NEO08498.1 exodeoxyribonuclease VII small subunit [Moorena sp. SIO3I8]